MKNLDWSNTQIVLVTGNGINACGHVLLSVGGDFFHYAGKAHGYPNYIPGYEYQSYLRINGKKELLRKKLDIPYPKKAQEELEKLMSLKWRYLLVSHNCVTFILTITQAGGNFWNFPPQCPVLDMSLTMMVEWFHKLSGIPIPVPRITIN